MNLHIRWNDKDEVLGLVNRMMTAIRRPESEYTRNLMNETQAQIDNFPDGMIGFTEMHEAGIQLDHMLPLNERPCSMNCTVEGQKFMCYMEIKRIHSWQNQHL